MATGYDPIKAVISFKAPSPDDDPINREEYGRGNFMWRHYRLWFQKKQKGDDEFYVYQTELNADGTELRPGKPIVVESDSRGTFNPNKETDEITVSEVPDLFPKWFKPKGPDLFPDDAVTYVNLDDDGKEYDKKEFLKNFATEHYIVVDKTSILRNPKGERVEVNLPPEKSPIPSDKTAMFRRCVRAAQEKAFSGGFDIMRKFQKKERKKQKSKSKSKSKSKTAQGQNDPKKYYGKRRMMEELKVQNRAPKRHPDPEAYSDGFGMLRQWQREHGAEPSYHVDPAEPFTGGFDIVRKWQRRHRKSES